MIRPLSVGVAGVLLTVGTSLGVAAHARSTATVAPAPQASTTITPTLQADMASLVEAQQPLRIAQTTSTAPTTASLEQAVFNQINAYRKSQGLAPLVLNSTITTQARIHSQNMANKTVPFGHQGFDQRVKAIGTVIPWSGAAENVAYNYGYSDPATQAVQGWLKSSGHLRNIRGNFDLTGIGVSRNAKGEIYFTQIFIKKR
ncbi:CAP domain-containing protein [Alkalinema sp. FACHB-956]|uniref:CAP domain-containing protein n=1 Tax=Alkalinema sp. FACHB-956 TaxID=2692768 RepID=UPI001687DF89|nr:CAP domain-containing protein [Alkalinema sp. FACHB-956]MBD2328915.1 CAP domain-containing protein [Alkalinema sp. FACHB-956]